jgi:hypothetical protein
MINLLWLHVVTDQHPNSAQQSPAAIGSLHVTWMLSAFLTSTSTSKCVW